jgi:hypothetical protein
MVRFVACQSGDKTNYDLAINCFWDSWFETFLIMFFSPHDNPLSVFLAHVNFIHFVSLHGQIGLCKGIEKGWHYDNILIFLKGFGP